VIEKPGNLFEKKSGKKPNIKMNKKYKKKTSAEKK
jgi:hypothetical protein